MKLSFYKNLQYLHFVTMATALLEPHQPDVLWEVPPPKIEVTTLHFYYYCLNLRMAQRLICLILIRMDRIRGDKFWRVWNFLFMLLHLTL